MPRVSVIIPAYNPGPYLALAIQSVIAQTYTDWELIVGDDGSDEETYEYLRTIQVEPRVKLLRLLHSGKPSTVRNAALREARGRYVAFLDSDDVWLPLSILHKRALSSAWSGRPSRKSRGDTAPA